MQIIENIESYIGIPYKDRGRSKIEGFDCWGLILDLTKQIHNVSLPDPEYEIKTVEDAENLFLANNMFKWVDKIEFSNTNEIKTKVQYGDLLTIKHYGKGKMPYHVGMCVKDKKVIHAMECGVVAQEVSIIKNYITGIYRLKGMI